MCGSFQLLFNTRAVPQITEGVILILKWNSPILSQCSVDTSNAMDYIYTYVHQQPIRFVVTLSIDHSGSKLLSDWLLVDQPVVPPSEWTVWCLGWGNACAKIGNRAVILFERKNLVRKLGSQFKDSNYLKLKWWLYYSSRFQFIFIEWESAQWNATILFSPKHWPAIYTFGELSIPYLNYWM